MIDLGCLNLRYLSDSGLHYIRRFLIKFLLLLRCKLMRVCCQLPSFSLVPLPLSLPVKRLVHLPPSSFSPHLFSTSDSVRNFPVTSGSATAEKIGCRCRLCLRLWRSLRFAFRHYICLAFGDSFLLRVRLCVFSIFLQIFDALFAGGWLCSCLACCWLCSCLACCWLCSCLACCWLCSSLACSWLCSSLAGCWLCSCLACSWLCSCLACGWFCFCLACGWLRFFWFSPAVGHAPLAVIVLVLLHSFVSALALWMWFCLWFLSPLALWLWICL